MSDLNVVRSYSSWFYTYCNYKYNYITIGAGFSQQC